jgi:hypothetical protein
MKAFIVKSLIRSYYLGAKVEFKPESKGTIRFSVQGKSGGKSQGFYRIRKIKSRPLALVEGSAFKVLHFGKVSIGVATEFERSVGGFGHKA